MSAEGKGYLMRMLSSLVVVWLLIGVLAAWQRGYLSHGGSDCARAGTIALTMLSGPLNYAGTDPHVTGCSLPQPS